MNRRILAYACLATTILSFATLPASSQTSIAVSAYGAFNRTESCYLRYISVA